MGTGINTLTYRGDVVGNGAVGVTSKPIRLSNPSVRAPLWQVNARINDEHPAFYWQHIFQIYMERDSTVGFASEWYSQMRTLVSSVGTLTLSVATCATTTASQTVTVMNYGVCACDGQELKQPSGILLFRAGITEVVFLGSQSPTVV